MPADWRAALDTVEREACGDAPVDTRICPECAGSGVVEYDYHHPYYYGERVERDTCRECGGSGEIEVEPVEEDDIARVG